MLNCLYVGGQSRSQRALPPPPMPGVDTETGIYYYIYDCRLYTLAIVIGQALLPDWKA